MNLAEQMTRWAERQRSVNALWLIGSQVRATRDVVERADAQSDWDFQIVTSLPERFATAAWTSELGLRVVNYAVRRAAISGLPKVAVRFATAEADLVVLPAGRLRFARWAVRLGWHRRSAGLRRSLQDLAVVIRPGWRMLKGGPAWQAFCERVVAEVPDPRLSDAAARNLAEGFVCDAIWVERKIDRGEWLAAQRMLHRSLAETNFQLLHELKLRCGERSFPEARRAERVLPAAERAMIAVAARPEPGDLRAALEMSATTCRALMQALVGATWQWPETP
ncbi:hypothetical protein [Opitutus terrae]|uniref:Uncharacterized protein n=1 Tax=Opitutus terrae (strain DSM 11246 / JCM 15787 / PB90-1) TaxID=452637 RepID=B1ZS92_OPITP|nr:hypothetical protein [Opitutus terrae]ACB75691.1 hypothetical protein Oter_2409 [Opitutus terrae PB90-1]